MFWNDPSYGSASVKPKPQFDLGREYLIEAARERAKEMVVFAVILVAAAWPVIYMIVSVVQLLHKGRPLDR